MGKAVILAAGRGSRLSNLTEQQPKCLSEVGGIAMIDWQIGALKRAGLEDILIVTGYRAKMLKDRGVRTIENTEWETTNMVSSLLCAEAEFGQSLVVSYSDIIYSHEIVERLLAMPADAVLTYDRQWLELWSRRFEDPLSDAESFMIDDRGRILDIGRSVDSPDQIQGQYMGLMKFSPQALRWIKQTVFSLEQESARQLDMTSLLQMLITEGRPVYGLPVDGGWCEVDTQEDWLLANRMCEEGAFG